jgi:hypothetical protein
MYMPENLDLFNMLGPFSLGAAEESWAQDGCQQDHFRDIFISVVPAGVRVTSPTLRYG